MRLSKRERILLGAVGALQRLIGKAHGANHDRNPNRQAEVSGYLSLAHDLCIDAIGRHGATSKQSERADKEFAEYLKPQSFV